MESPRHSCLKLELPNPTEPDEIEPIFIKATWYDTHFDLSITNDPDSWVCKASEEEVRERAAQWDQPEADYIELAERYLGFQQPGSVYKFTDAENRTKLEWRWKCQPSPNPQQTNSGILNFLMDANIRLSEEVVRKTKSFERLKVETENAWHRVNVSAMRRQSLCLQSMQSSLVS
ncbi:DNA repair protein XRCC4-like isoform X3 [Punica granatum]|uniref:DNA repair protein XRCC4-like isoform X3 n=1 Tax=Punica granatum TaxID=22663 RepID=A0A6P8DTD6_PUNGR|nr:DNA repair protein XRCC4-like isoform X3 [Punica granatum]